MKRRPDEAFANRGQRRRLGGLSSNVHKGLSDYVWDRDNGTCVYCDGPGQEIDHIVPFKLGGPTIAGNLLLACRYCNIRKGANLSVEVLTIAFRHILAKGDSVQWVEDLWEETRWNVKRAIEATESQNSPVLKWQQRETWESA